MIFPFLVSFFLFAHINFIGELYVSEVILLIYLMFSAGKLHLLADPFPKKVLMLGVLWLLSQMFTDWYRDSIPENYLRGWAAIIFFLIDFCAVYLMVLKNPDVIRTLIFGSALGTIFSTVFLPTDYSDFEPWKFGYGLPVTMFVLLYLSTAERYKTKAGLALLVGLGVLSVYLNARSLGGMTILTAAILYILQRPIFKLYANRRPDPIILVGFGLSVLLALYGIKLAYEWVAESGYLPENVTEKYLMGKGKDTGLLGVIAGGRPEILISSQAVMDSPIIGHGSWAADSYYANMQYKAVEQLGLNIDEAQLEYVVGLSDLIPIHSVLMQAWVWAGALGAVFWFYIFRFLVAGTVSSVFSSSPLKPLQLFFGIYFIWNILFSPFGSNQRFMWALAIMIVLLGSKLFSLANKQPLKPSRPSFIFSKRFLRNQKLVSEKDSSSSSYEQKAQS